jgi:hypothetical protein
VIIAAVKRGVRKGEGLKLLTRVRAKPSLGFVIDDVKNNPLVENNF